MSKDPEFVIFEFVIFGFVIFWQIVGSGSRFRWQRAQSL